MFTFNLLLFFLPFKIGDRAATMKRESLHQVTSRVVTVKTQSIKVNNRKLTLEIKIMHLHLCAFELLLLSEKEHFSLIC